MSLSQKQHFVCGECLKNRFEQAHPTKEDKINLPESIHWRLALWNFDKGGYLQDLLHELKYKGLSRLGEDLGRALGSKLKMVHQENWETTELLPVPLHRARQRQRGFNQAYHIALGVQQILKCGMLDEEAVQRMKKTGTQTGFSMERRRSNVHGAFMVCRPDQLAKKAIIIIDDVFTTGATTFELARELQDHGVKAIYIATIAQA